LQIYSATILPNIIKIGKSYCENQKGELV